MKNLLFTFVILILILFSGSKSSTAQTFYDLSTIQKIELVFSESNWDYKLDTAKAGSEGYIMAQSVTINGVQFDSVGVKYKGNSTYNANSKKNPFHIELDSYKNQDFEGYTDIKLSNVSKDPSFVREVLSYSILRQYMHAPLSNYANVYVNGTLIGLYVSSESVNKSFINSKFGSKSNAFFKCNPIGGAGPGTTTLPNLVYLGADSSLYYSAYEMNSDYGWADLINLCNTLKNNTGEIESILDVDRALWMLAYDNLIVNLDSYIGGFSQNYYLYKDKSGRFSSVMWDFNESFGTFSMTGTISLPNTTSKSQMTPLLHSGDANWPLVQKLLAVPTYKKMYLAHLQTMMTENFSNSSYLTTAQTLQSVINTSVQADPNKPFTYAQYQSNLTTDVNSGPGGPGSTSAPGISALMNGRVMYLSALADFTATKPSISNVNPSEASPKANSNIYITATVTNATSVYLGYRYKTTEKFTKVAMSDDGNHGDGTSGDSVFGAEIASGTGKIEYYLFAENTSSGVFSPARAEFEFYSLTVSTKSESDVMMNEIYARGTAENPDWIELFNSTSAPIDISGYKIYDSGGNEGTKPKMEIPSGSTIAAGGFFVLVTDDGSATGFGLSNGGEKVWFETSSGVVIDSVNFKTHTATQSYGRVTDGHDWQLLTTISRGSTNGTGTGLDDDGEQTKKYELSQNYPNPFNPSTEISFTLPKTKITSLVVYNLVGQEVAQLFNGLAEGGKKMTFTFNGNGLSSGIYLYRLQSGSFSSIKKMTLLK